MRGGGAARAPAVGVHLEDSPHADRDALLKLLLFSDLHLDRAFRWAGERVARKRRQALRDTLLRIIKLATDERVDAVFCGGDLYEHERFSADTGEFLRSAFERLETTPIYIAPGNHDWYGRESLYQQVRWSPNVHVFSTDSLKPVKLDDGLTLWGAAHCAPANTRGFLERATRLGGGGVHLGLFHASEVGLLQAQGAEKIPHAPFRTEQIARAGLAHAFLGHFHKPQDADLFTYPGNPDPLEFGEEGDRGAVIVIVRNDGSITRERRLVAVSEVHDLSVDVTGCSSQQDVRDLLSARLAGISGAARVTLDGELGTEAELELRDLQEIAPHLDAVVVRPGSLRVGYDIDRIAAEQTVAGQFVREVRASDLPAEAVSRILVTGLRALEGRKDLEVF
jgi:DNA repair protein SbcD/Mre11